MGHQGSWVGAGGELGGHAYHQVTCCVVSNQIFRKIIDIPAVHLDN